jgi:nucleoside phosphorylase
MLRDSVIENADRAHRHLYLHFLDAYHSHRALRNANPRRTIFEEAQRAFRISLCLSDCAYIPASSFFESDLAREMLERHPLTVATGKVRLTSGDASLEEHREGKLAQYRPDSPLALGLAYVDRIDSNVGYEARGGNTRLHLETRWLERLYSDSLQNEIDPFGDLHLNRSLERAWGGVPDALGDLAFVPGHAEKVLSKLWRGDTRLVRSFIARLIESSYVEMYMLSLGAGAVRDLVMLQSPFPIPTHPDSISYARSLHTIIKAGLLPKLDSPSESLFISSQQELQLALYAGKASASTATSQATGSRMRKSQEKHRPKIGIVTILEEEFRAMLLQLENRAIKAIPGDPHAYVHGFLRSTTHNGSNGMSVAVVKQLRMTNVSAATTVTSLLKAFPTIRDVVLVGIGGAIPRPHSADKNVALGDVVVSDRSGVWHSDHVAVIDGRRNVRQVLPPPSPRLLGALDRLSVQGDVQSLLAASLKALEPGDARFTRPHEDADVLMGPNRRVLRRGGVAPESRIFRGVIASGNALVRDPAERDRIGQMSGALALDMESAGVAEAAWSGSRQYLLIRGLSDYCDQTKNDQWHWYAAGSAACVAALIVDCLTD